MIDPKRLTEEWKEFRPQLGNFIGRIDFCIRECGDAEAIYQKGYNEGSKKSSQCDICLKAEWWEKTASDVRLRKAIEEIMQLQPDSQMLIYSLIDKLHSIKNIKLVDEIWKTANSEKVYYTPSDSVPLTPVKVHWDNDLTKSQLIFKTEEECKMYCQEYNIEHYGMERR